MKYKMTAVLVALAMMFAGVFVMADGDGADADVQAKTISIAQGETQTFQIMTNETAYLAANNSSITSYEAKWSVDSVAEGDITTGVTKDDITYVVTKVAGDKNLGLYDVKVTAASGATASSTALEHKLIFTVTAKVGTNDADKIVLTYEYPVSVTVTAKTADITLKAMTFTKDLAGTASVEVESGSLTVTDYNWYAISLPAGLGMSKDGTVSGLATTVVGSASYKVTAVEKNPASGTVPKTYSLSLSLEVKAASTEGSVVITFTNASVIGATDNKITYTNIGGTATANSFNAYAEEGKTDVKFSVAAGTGSTSVSVTKVVSVDGSTGATKDYAGGADSYTLDTSGTGSYKTMVYVNVDGQNAVLIFNFLVLENVHGDWAPAIVINGN
jgi:hypothetical protein